VPSLSSFFFRFHPPFFVSSRRRIHYIKQNQPLDDGHTYEKKETAPIFSRIFDSLI
jgi:hypothetical protein